MNAQVGIDPYHRFRVPGEDDPCIRRHGGSPESMAEWEKVKPNLRETYERILTLYRQEGRPLAPKEICEMLGKHPSDLSGRFTELKEMGLLVPTQNSYKGSRCLELAEVWLQRQLGPKVVTPEQVLQHLKDIRGPEYVPGERDLEFSRMVAEQATEAQNITVKQVIEIASLIRGTKLNLSVQQIQMVNRLVSRITEVFPVE
jgi:hypothetical protein